ncbi:MAG: aldo/keto reductase [Planctomycetota bacterium]|nr:MAG: aldo/keto reductase [Planctomycetota bacterium]
MAPRELGRSGLRVTPIGFGAFKLGRNEGIKYSSGYALPDDATAARILREMVDLGINYVDTAPAYGISEQRVGAALGGRGDVVISTKVGETFAQGRSTYDFSEAAVRASVQLSRQRLRRDVLDVVFVHAHADDVAILRDTDVVGTLRSLREAGVVRAVGFSGKTVQAAEMALSWADALMVEYHLEDRSHEEVIAEAHRRGVGVVVKKGLASGRLEPGDAVRFVLSHPGVTSLVIGGLSVEHMRENLRAARDALAGGGDVAAVD